jgi:hypothetical protein
MGMNKLKGEWTATAVAGLIAMAGADAAKAAEFYQTSTPGATTDIRAAELPPEPGFYMVGGLVGVNRDAVNDANGDPMFPDTDAKLRIGSLGGLYVYPDEFLGGRMASSLVFTYGQNKMTITNTTPADLSSDNTGSFDAYSDIFFWSKSWYAGPPPASPGQRQPSPDYVPPMPVGFTLGLGFGVTIPIGDFDNQEVGNPGFNNWVLSPNIAVTYRTPPILLDATEFSARLFYNHNFDREDSTGGFTYRDGDYFSLDFAITERYQRYQFGLAGNAKWQIEDDEGSLAVPAADGQRHRSLQLGPIVAVDFPEYRSSISLKYLTDVVTENAFEGQYLMLSFNRKIW